MVNETTEAHGTKKVGEVYFLSHGGPPHMFDTTSRAYEAWQDFGRLIRESNPKGMIIVSAHWENPSNTEDVLVNEDISNPLLFDFYGFPPHYYKVQFNSKGTQELVNEIKSALGSNGVGYQGVERGLDHGVFVPLKVAFDGETDIPIVQVSLPGDSNPVSVAKLGTALGSLREKGYSVVGSGQVVHNLRDFAMGLPQPYSAPFTEAANKAAHSPKVLEQSLNLFSHPMYNAAHPTAEHLLALIAATGAVKEGDKVEDIWVGRDPKGMGWGIWRWTSLE